MPSRSGSRSNRFKRPYNNKRRSIARRHGVTLGRATAAATQLQAAVRSAIARNIETKRSNHTSTDYVQIGHNNFVTVDELLLGTTQGVEDPTTTQGNNRIGDEITLKAVSIKMMLELNERYSDVTYRILVIKTAKGDVPTNATLFNGLSGNKMLDTLNRERFTICYEKWGKIKAPNMTIGDSSTSAGTSTGIYYNSGSAQTNFLSRATKIVKFYLPFNKFQKSPILKYQNGTSQLKFFDYRVVVYAYSNYNTSEALGYNVLAVNDYVKTMYFKDA